MVPVSDHVTMPSQPWLGPPEALMRKPLVLAPLMLASVAFAAQEPSARGYVPPDGFVPDSITAVRVAEAVWFPIYGEQHILSERPFVAKLSGGVWTVTGTLPNGTRGGTAVAKIAKRDGRVLFVWHYK
jgi:hypothetical protein